MSLTIAQEAWSEGRRYWGWRLELQGPPEELDQVDWVEYTLHPTFSPPVHRVTNRTSNFRLEGSGWGEFMVHVAVRDRDGNITRLEHWLELDGLQVKAAPSARGPKQVSGIQIAQKVAPPEAPLQESGLPNSAPGVAADPEELSVAAPAPAAPSPEAAAAAQAIAPTGVRVYLSSALADRQVARQVEGALHEAGIETTSNEDLQAAADAAVDSTDTLIRQAMESVSGAIFIVSRRLTPWLQLELGAASTAGLPVALVNVGGTSALPTELLGRAMMTVVIATQATPDQLVPLMDWARRLPQRTRRPLHSS